MARAHLKMVVQDQLGNVLRSAKVFVWETGTVTPVADLFTAATGGAAVADAGLVTNTQGEIEGWLSSPRDVALRVTDNGGAAVYAARPTVGAGFSAFTEDPVAVREDPDEERQEDAGFIHVLAWAADPTGVASSTQAFVDAAASASGDLVVGSGTFLLSSDLTIDRQVRFAEGAVLKPAAGVEVTITGHIDAGPYQIFDLSLGGTVTPMRRTIADWFGSVGDGLAFRSIDVTSGGTTLTVNDAGAVLPPAADIVGKTVCVPAAAAGITWSTVRAETSMVDVGGQTNVATTLNVAPGDGALFRVHDVVLVGSEQERVTAIAGDVLTVARAQGGTVAAAHLAGDPVTLVSLTLPVETLPLTDNTGFAPWVTDQAYGLVYVGGHLVSYDAIDGSNNLLNTYGGEGIVAAGTPVAKVVAGPDFPNFSEVGAGGQTNASTLLVVPAGDGDLFHKGDVLLIGTEEQFVSQVEVAGADTLTVSRGYRGTVAAAHAAGDPITRIGSPTPHSRWDHNTVLRTTIAARLSDTTLQLADAAGASVVDGVADVAGTDNREAWDACLAATVDGGTMLFGPGIHDGERADISGSDYQGVLRVHDRRDVTFDALSAHVTIRLRPNSPNDRRDVNTVRLLRCKGVTITDRVTVDGSNMTILSAEEQVHNVQLENSQDCDIDCATERAYGDAIRFTGSNVPGDSANWARDLRVTGRHRSFWRACYQFQRGVSDIDIFGEAIADTEMSGGFIHCEPSGSTLLAPQNVRFHDVATRQLGSSNGRAPKVGMQVQGITQTNRCKGWRFNGGHIDGSVKLSAGCEDFEFDGTTIEGDPNNKAFELDREVQGVRYVGGVIRGRYAENPVVSANYVANAGQVSNVYMDTTIEQHALSSGAAVRLEDVDVVTVLGRVVAVGAGHGSALGVLVNNTDATVGVHRDIHIDCDIKGFVMGERFATYNTAETYEGCSSRGARYDDDPAPVMTTGIEYTSSAGAAEWLKNHRLEATFGPEVTTPLSIGATVKYLVTSGSPPDRADYRVAANPEGVVSAVPGSTARSTAGAKYLKVTGTGNTGWWPDGGPLVATTQAGAYQLALTDAATVIESSAAGAVNLTVPANATVAFPVGTIIEVFQQGAGQVTVVAAGGVTLRAPGGAKTRTQYSTISLRKRATNEWVVSGDTTT